MTILDDAAVPIADLYITSELDRRAPKKTDYLKEKEALQDLALHMAEHPETVLPRFVDLAMEMTGGVSAGLSLLEEMPLPGVFRWRYLRGILAPFENATTPRNFSPCGITLDQNRPVLSRHPERFYDWISDAHIEVPEVLLVPLYIGSREPLGTLWIIAGQTGHFDSGHARALTELASFVGIALTMLRSEQKLKQALEQQETLAGEMTHRVKNLFAIAEGMIRLSARAAADKDELVRLLSGRMSALANAHSLVRRDFAREGRHVGGSQLRELLQAIVRPHEGAGSKARFTIQGPELYCGEQSVNGVALVFHELATNAVKYGALRDEDGRIDIDWTIDGADLRLLWRERDGPLLAEPPETTGFGSKLLNETLVRQFRGVLAQDWKPEGLSVTIIMPLQSLTA